MSVFNMFGSIAPTPMASSAIQVASNVERLQWEIHPESLEVPVDGLDELVDIAYGLERADAPLGRTFFRQLGELQVALAMSDTTKLITSQKLLAAMVGGLNKKRWRIVLQSIQARGGVHARRDQVLPYVREVFTKNLVASTEKLVLPLHVSIPPDEGWEPFECWGTQCVHIRVKKGEQTHELIIHETVSGTTLEFMREQARKLDEVVVEIISQKNLASPSSLSAVLKKVALDPEINKHPWFIIRSHRLLSNHYFDDEAYWIATWALAPGVSERALYILMKGKDEDTGESASIWVPLKTFVRAYAFSKYQQDPRDIYSFSPFDLAKFIEEQVNHS